MEFIWQLKGSLHYTISALWVYSVDGLGEIPSLTDGGHFTADYNKIVYTHTDPVSNRSERNTQEKWSDRCAETPVTPRCRFVHFEVNLLKVKSSKNAVKKKSTQQMFNGLALTDNNILISTKIYIFSCSNYSSAKPGSAHWCHFCLSKRLNTTKWRGVSWHHAALRFISTSTVGGKGFYFIPKMFCTPGEVYFARLCR